MKNAQKVVPRSGQKAGARNAPTARDCRIQPPPQGLSDLASLLAEEVRESVRSCRDEPVRDAQEVLLDKEMNGYRLIVVRSRATADQAVSLSPREFEIARMIGKGLPNKAIAGVLEISSWTVGTHLRRIFAKLGVTSRAAMVTRMVELGLSERFAHRPAPGLPLPNEPHRGSHAPGSAAAARTPLRPPAH